MVDVQPAPIEERTEPAPPALPDYVLSPNAVFKDEGAQWRYGKPPDYSKTRKVWEEGRKMNHAAGSLEQIVENLVKNWEVEASFKPRLSDWRTIDAEKYSFAMSGGPPQSGELMLKVGTYNAIIAPNEYYDPSNSDFASSHKTFKRMMPTFAWEVMEVYSGPPKVVFKWRHWGVMKNDYVGFNNKGQKVTAKAHGGPIEIYGTTIAIVDDQLRVQSLDTYMDSLDMFRQIAPHGVVNNQPMNRKVGLADALEDDAPHNDGIKIAQEYNQTNGKNVNQTPENADQKHISNSTGQPADAFVPNQGACPFMGMNGTDGAGAPHPLPPQTRSQSGEAMSVDGSSADTEFSDSVLISHESVVPESLPATPAVAHEDVLMTTPQKAADTQANTTPDTAAAQQGAPMELDTPIQTTTTFTSATNDGDATTGAAHEPHASKRPASDLADSTDMEIPRSIYSSAVTGNLEEIIKAPRMAEQGTGSFVDESTATGTRDAVDEHLEKSPGEVHPHSKDIEARVQPVAGEAVIAAADSEETKRAKEEMSDIRGADGEKELVMNRE